MKKILVFIISIFSIFSIFSICGCTSDKQSEYVELFDWMVKTFEENDAGFEYYLEEKGTEEYTRHTQAFREKMKLVEQEDEFLSLSNEWLSFFREGHIGVSFKESNLLSEENKNVIRAKYSNEECIDLTEGEFIEYLQENKNTIDWIEGIWHNRDKSYIIGILRSKEVNNKYDGFIIKADSVYWQSKQKILELTLRSDGCFDGIFKRKDRRSIIINEIKKMDDLGGVISIMDDYWVKQYPEESYSSKDKFFIESVSVNKPFLRKLNEATIYLRIPSFRIEQKGDIEALLNQNDKLIKATPNLIIDIRNGTGGGDSSHAPLIPYYYTQPIRIPWIKYRATELNACAYEKFVENSKDSAAIERCRFIANKMRENKGGYYVADTDVQLYDFYTPLKYPSKVAIICNNHNASADESFLYMARQSYKVKIFGVPTHGAFDVSNVNIVDFPNGKYVLWLAMSVPKQYPQYKIDDVGIQPDYYIDKSICESDWIEFVQSTVEK